MVGFPHHLCHKNLEGKLVIEAIELVKDAEFFRVGIGFNGMIVVEMRPK
jgi:hypothetical protein